MATTTFGTNDPETVKAWSRRLSVEVPKATDIAPLIGNSMSSIIYKKDELSKGPGDRVRCTLRSQLVGRGATEGETLEGNEESIQTFTDDLLINELRHAVRSKNTGSIDQQRISFNLRDQSYEALRDWMADRMSMCAFVQWGGYTGTSITFEGDVFQMEGVTYGFNAPVAPSKIVRPAGRASDQAIETADNASDDFTLAMIDRAVYLAKTSNPKVRPVRIDGRNKYVMYIHPAQTYSLRTRAGSGQWLDVKLRDNDPRRQKSSLYDGAIGEWNGVIIRESEHVAPGVDTTDDSEITSVRRAVLLGAQSLMLGYGRGSNTTNMGWREELFDYAQQVGVKAGTLWGMKKSRFNNSDYGCVVVSSRAVDPNA